ncbi:MAG: DUF1573 domain-containing protein [Patescibacteria group bacterium]|nr:DUF1573 domain-containing protein [Patescibacteria group bacterium]
MKLKIKPFLILITAILVLAIYGYFQSIPESEQGQDVPKIELTSNFFDFGEVEYGKVLEHSFQVKNIGKKVLEIQRIATSCACTSAVINKEQINPNEQAELTVEYDTGAMSGPHGQGKQERIIYIKTNDPLNPQIEITINAYVR